ncbi:FAD-binding domain-containing protein [Epithele typhae]|uniref:FAD-binding domain-containing protein n=1 Tax=Epithele typhae TaxID=378194 RepID=UPI002007EF72|nr:FAD-binding domain-containing protein [Epithele typhae]KAH9942500.1 FAD-binding domain-containing protein [Epithele typhae]
MSPNLESLKSSFSGDLVGLTDSAYPAAIVRWARNAARRAALVAFPRSPGDVALAIAYARAQGLQLAVKGGGHSPSGASSVEGGLVIDLGRHMAGVRVDAAARRAYVAGGALWGAVDKAAIEHGLATVGGTVNHTGVGGLVLGGGYGWLAGAHGLAIDNLLEATVVTADGQVITASPTSHPDLFWGLRGGGSNFGVVTEFVLQLHPQRRTVFCGMAVFGEHQLEQFLDVTEAWWNNGTTEKEGMIHAFTRSPMDRSPCIVAFMFYNGSEAEGRDNFKAFFDIGPVMDATAERPYEELNSLQNAIAAPGQAVYMKGTFAPATYPRALLPRVFARAAELSAPEGYHIGFLLEYHSLGKVDAVPDAQTAYRRGAGPNALCTVFMQEDGEGRMAYAQAAARELVALVAGDKAHLAYGNYSDDPAGEEGAPATAGASKAEVNFGSNYARLREVKKAYDPEQVFNKWFNIDPAA